MGFLNNIMTSSVKFEFKWTGLLLAASCLAGLPASGVFVGQVDDFEDGTTQNWTIGNPNGPFAPSSLPNGGPGGTGDGYLQLNSSGTGGPGGKLTAYNPAQWSGDYIAAGVTGVQAWFNNFGSNPVTMRLSFASGFGAGSSFTTATTIDLSPGSGWTAGFFPINESAIVQLSGSDGFSQAFLEITEVRLLSAVAPAFSGDLIAATVGVDDLAVIPEPAAGWLMLGAVLILARRFNRGVGNSSRSACHTRRNIAWLRNDQNKIRADSLWRMGRPPAR